MAEAVAEKPKGWALIKLALSDKRSPTIRGMP